MDISNIASLEGAFYGLISAISLSLIITIGERFSSQLGGLKVAFSQLLVASIILFKFTYEAREWLIDNIAVSVFLGFFLTGVGLTTYWYVVKIIKPIVYLNMYIILIINTIHNFILRYIITML